MPKACNSISTHSIPESHQAWYAVCELIICLTGLRLCDFLFLQMMGIYLHFVEHFFTEQLVLLLDVWKCIHISMQNTAAFYLKTGFKAACSPTFLQWFLYLSWTDWNHGLLCVDEERGHKCWKNEVTGEEIKLAENMWKVKQSPCSWWRILLLLHRSSPTLTWKTLQTCWPVDLSTLKQRFTAASWTFISMLRSSLGVPGGVSGS